MKDIQNILLCDISFLLGLHVMDYSLFLTVEKVGAFTDAKGVIDSEDKKEVEESAEGHEFELIFDNRNVYISDDGKYLYQLGIIDYL